MKPLTPLFLSLLFVGGTIACGKDSQAPTVQSQRQTQAVPAGTTFAATLPTELSTGKNRDQDRFVLSVKNSSVGAHPSLKGAKIEGHLENVVKAARGRKAKLHLVFDEITFNTGSSQPLQASLVNTQLETKTKGQFLKNTGIILAGTTAGHIAGKKAGKKHGGLAGAAAATAFVLASPGGEVVLKKGTDITLKLKSPLEPASSGR